MEEASKSEERQRQSGDLKNGRHLQTEKEGNDERSGDRKHLKNSAVTAVYPTDRHNYCKKQS